MRLLRAGVLYFALVFAAGFVLGVARTLLLEPRVGARAAEVAEVPVMVGLSILAAWFVVRRYCRGWGRGRRLAVGGIALLLLVACEAAMVGLVRGQTLERYLASRDVLAFDVYLVGLALFTLMPALVNGAMGSKRYRRSAHAR
jgi:hypothetical protein